MKDRQELLRRLDHYAECMDNGVHVTGSQMRKLVLDIREIGLLHMAPPSAPVGVAADILRIVDTAIDVCNDRDRPAMAEDLEAVRLYVEQASAPLAQQPAAVDRRHPYVQSKDHGGCANCGYPEWEPWHALAPQPGGSDNG